MSKRIRSKYKINRRLGVNLWGRPKSPVNSREYGPGQHGRTRRSKPTDFGIQLMAKQKLKGYYGNISEKQFRKYYAEAVRRKGDTSENLIGILESRLDAVVYRMKFVPTVFASRQFVSHGHIEVNGKRVNIPSYRVRQGDVVSVRAKARNGVTLQWNIDVLDRGKPAWLDAGEDKYSAVVHQLPLREHIDVPVREQLIVELYSK